MRSGRPPRNSGTSFREGPSLLPPIAEAHRALDGERAESAMAFDASGNERFRTRPGSGTADEIFLTDEQLRLMKDAVVVHNHPEGWSYPPSNPRHAGKSFSQEDVFMAFEHDVLELQAVTPVWIYWMSRPAGGWGQPSRQAQRRFVDLVNHIVADMVDLIKAGRLTVEEAEPELYHLAMVALADEFGFGYGRARRSVESTS
jgi:hypothetical protein